ncbi:MAG: TetR/AcrR family transcriptional regulator [Phycisphaerales bacterium]|nr:TetR/AcrR family transcriptional regulator [Phycisphaerales bacterium]
MIVDAAQTLLDEGGPNALTLPAVSDRADVAVQTVYNRVGGRSALLMAVAERALSDNREYMDAAYATPGKPIERILLAGAAYARFAIERPHQFRLLADPPEALERVVDLVLEQNQKLEAAIAEGIAGGTIDRSLNAPETATVLWAMMNGLLALTWRADRLRAVPEDLTKTVTTLITNGLSPHAR